MREPRLARRRWQGAIETIVDRCLEALSGPDEEERKHIKVTEVIKLIELHGKLSEEQTGTGEFWDMIERIRAEVPPITSKYKTPENDAGPGDGEPCDEPS
jgi:hypothetical protein